MSPRTIAVYGINLPNIDGFTIYDFISKKSLLDPDIIVVNLSLNNFYSDSTYQARPLMSKRASFEFKSVLTSWHRSIRSAIELGKTVIFFLSDMEEVYYHTGQTQISGTGRNRKEIDIVESTNNYALLPTSLKNIVFASGKSMRPNLALELNNPIWEKFSDIMEYSCYYEVETATPLIYTKTGDHVVGSFMQENGHLVLLPRINFDKISVYEHDEEGNYVYDADGEHVFTDEIIRFSHELRGKILEFDKLLRKPTETSVKPEWSSASDFRLPDESDIEAEITSINEKIENLEQIKRLKQENLESEISLRGLLYLKGRELEELVLSSLQYIGFSAANFKDGDSEFDAIFISEEGRFIGEVEGKDNKAINVDKISQLQRNIIEDLKKPEVSEAASESYSGTVIDGQILENARRNLQRKY